MGKKILVIGAVACGPKAAARARRMDPEAEILVVDRGTYPSYAGCGLPFYVAGAVKIMDGLFTTAWGAVRNAEYFRNVKNIDLRMGTAAESIDRVNKKVTMKDLATGKSWTAEYDKLVLATGASPVVPPIEGMNLKNVFTLRRPEDADAIVNCINETNAEKAVILGGGRISLEVVDALTAQAVDSTVVEMMGQLLPNVLDADMAAMLERAVKKEGVQVFTGEKVVRLEGDESGAVKKVVTDKREIEADFVLMAAGVRPNTELAKNAGLSLDAGGTISVDEYMRTSDPDIYAGGDCVLCDSIVTGGKTYAPLGSTANKHGRVIGTNVCGGNEKFPGVLGTGIMKTMGMNVARTGITEAQAVAKGINAVTSLAPAHDKSHFYPGGKEIMIKLIADAADGRLLGAQVIGPGDVLSRINPAAAAISAKETAAGLANLDLAYAPPFATAMDPLIHAANVIRNKIDGRARGISAADLKAALSGGDDLVVVDVRTPGEQKSGVIKDSRLIAVPLEELKGRVSEIPKGKKTVTICKMGTRSYEAALTLEGEGFADVSFVEGGMAAWADE